MKILITGSEGLIGKIISKELKKEYDIIPIDDKIKGRDILKYDLTKYFSDADILIHLAVAYNGLFEPKQALKNLEISKRVLEYCENLPIKKIINASSINVYPYFEIYDSAKKITDKTSLSQNMVWGEGKYGEMKIRAEELFTNYCKEHKIPLLNLRIGCVTPDNKPSRKTGDSLERADHDIYLKHKDLIKIINKCINTNTQGNYVCVSKKDGFIDRSIRFPI